MHWEQSPLKLQINLVWHFVGVTVQCHLEVNRFSWMNILIFQISFRDHKFKKIDAPSITLSYEKMFLEWKNSFSKYGYVSKVTYFEEKKSQID